MKGNVKMCMKSVVAVGAVLLVQSVLAAIRLASGATSPVTVVNGIPTFGLPDDDRADAYADAFELK